MSAKRSIESQFTSVCEMQTASVREAWRKALRQGDYAAAIKLMNTQNVSPNTPGEVTGENPVKTMSMADRHSSYFVNQQTLANILIEKGLELRTPDKFGMYPADWAMLSGNREMARTVVKETIRQFHEHGRRKEYMPNVDPFFAICINWEQRKRRFDNLVFCHNSVGQSLIADRVKDDQPQKNNYQGHLSDEQAFYWQRPYLRKQADMPYYTPDLIRAVKAKWQTTKTPLEYATKMGRGTWLLDVEEGHDDVYRAQIARVRDLRREKREKELSPN